MTFFAHEQQKSPPVQVHGDFRQQISTSSCQKTARISIKTLNYANTAKRRLARQFIRSRRAILSRTSEFTLAKWRTLNTRTNLIFLWLLQWKVLLSAIACSIIKAYFTFVTVGLFTYFLNYGRFSSQYFFYYPLSLDFFSSHTFLGAFSLGRAQC